MARLDVYPMPGRGKCGYVLEVQAELPSHFNTRTLVPLLPVADAPKPIVELNPIFEIGNQPHVMVTQAIASVPTRALRRSVAPLVSHHDQITRALHILLLGY